MKSVLTFLVALFILIGGAYIYWFYFNPYGDGFREGVLQKFSRKGHFFKTHEGEIIQLGFGQRGGQFHAQYFYFSVEDPQVADSLSRSVGKKVRVHYTQYRRALPWRGEAYGSINAEEGQYIVDAIMEVEEPDRNMPALSVDRSGGEEEENGRPAF